MCSQRRLCEGISLCPEAAVCLGVLERALDEGAIERDAFVVVFNTGAAQKYVELLDPALPRLDHSFLASRGQRHRRCRLAGRDHE